MSDVCKTGRIGETLQTLPASEYKKVDLLQTTKSLASVGGRWSKLLVGCSGCCDLGWLPDCSNVICQPAKPRLGVDWDEVKRMYW